MSNSRIGGLYRRSIAERIDHLRQLGWLSEADAELLRQGRQVLLPAAADRMTENVVGVFGLPLAIAPNFTVDGRDYIVPMVVEEPSVVAATSSAAKLARDGGGFATECAESLLAGQVHLSHIAEPAAALARINAAEKELLAQANGVQPRLSERGGGVRDLEVRRTRLPDGAEILIVHLLVDTCDAMGANLVNTICEAIAPRLAELAGGKVALRILSNLADRSVVRARARFPLDKLATADLDGAAVRDQIVLASDIAKVDLYRAATHNKGIMNGVDAVAIATGNDWRAIEAGAHAYAAARGGYEPLAAWSVADNGDLVGEIGMPLKVGIVGGNFDANAGAALGLRIAGVGAADELARLMAAVGLAQNFAALKALATSGIQEGHMKLHARSVASSAGVPDDVFDDVVDELIATGDIKVWKAAEILATRKAALKDEEPAGTAAGKVILLGEHGVVYGNHALAVPIPAAVAVTLARRERPSTISVPSWGVVGLELSDESSPVAAVVAHIRKALGIEDAHFDIHMHSALPRAMGLGSSAACAVAITRAFVAELGLALDNAAVNALAFECEKISHGTPSGIDNTVATYSEAMLFRNGDSLQVETLNLSEAPPLLIACSSQPGLTAAQVAQVRARYDRTPAHYEAIFSQMGALSRAGAVALVEADYAELGLLMNVCHGLLNAIQVSTPELESMVSIARAAGAVGAKLTGGGGGGSIVALCPDATDSVQSALETAGFKTLTLTQE